MLDRSASLFLGLGLISWSGLFAASLGVATSGGPFKIDNATVHGTATLREGSTVETISAPSNLRLSNGSRFELDAASRAKIFSDRLVLERGSGEFVTGPSFRVESKSLRISAGEPGVRAKIALREDRKVQIASAAGRMHVRNAAGMLISNVEPGIALEFEPQAGGAALPSSFVGCLLEKEGKFVIYDQTTKMVVELKSSGPDLRAEVGNRVQANGTARPGANNSQTLDVTTITQIEKGGCAEIARLINADRPPATAGARTPAGEPRAGMSAGTKVAIIAGVIAGGAGGALAATQGGSDNRSR